MFDMFMYFIVQVVPHWQHLPRILSFRTRGGPGREVIYWSRLLIPGSSEGTALELPWCLFKTLVPIQSIYFLICIFLICIIHPVWSSSTGSVPSLSYFFCVCSSTILVLVTFQFADFQEFGNDRSYVIIK